MQASQKDKVIQLPNSDLPLAISYDASSLQQMRICVTARLKILKARSSHSATSVQVQDAVHMYLAKDMPSCRSEGNLGKETLTVSPAHLQIVHEVGLMSLCNAFIGFALIFTHGMCFVSDASQPILQRQ